MENQMIDCFKQSLRQKFDEAVVQDRVITNSVLVVVYDEVDEQFQITLSIGQNHWRAGTNLRRVLDIDHDDLAKWYIEYLISESGGSPRFS